VRGRRSRRACLAAVCTVATLASAPGLATALPAPNLSAAAATLIEESTGQQLFGLGADQQLPIASTTKLMTALLTLEHARLTRVFAQNNYYAAAIDSQIGLVPGERMSVHDLLLALLLPSADDAAEDLAYNVGGGSVGYFVGMMNVRARELGLVHTHYSTPSGLDTPGNYSSASDLVRLASFVLRNHPFFARAVALPSAVLHTGSHVRVVANRNDLVGQVPWINGVKTGHTRGAGYVLVGSGTRHGMTLLSAVLGTSSASARDSNTLTVLGWGFDNFRIAKPVVAGSVVARLTVRDQPGVRAVVIAARAFVRVVQRRTRVTKRIELPRQLAGPLRRHAVVGTLLVLVDGRMIARVPLLLARALRGVSPLTLAARFVTRPFMLLLLVALLAGVGALTLYRRERIRGRRPDAAQA
jgi:serine-type D-Ala-D-Ala carboxypeptidase (penicillin-binding protein 5/6)